MIGDGLNFVEGVAGRASCDTRGSMVTGVLVECMLLQCGVVEGGREWYTGLIVVEREAKRGHGLDGAGHGHERGSVHPSRDCIVVRGCRGHVIDG